MHYHELAIAIFEHATFDAARKPLRKVKETFIPDWEQERLDRELKEKIEEAKKFHDLSLYEKRKFLEDLNRTAEKRKKFWFKWKYSGLNRKVTSCPKLNLPEGLIVECYKTLLIYEI